MTIKRMDRVGIVEDDLAAATRFFVRTRLELQGEGAAKGHSLDHIVGLDGVRTDFVMMQTPDGNARLELIKLHSPPTQGGDRPAPANTPGLSPSRVRGRGHRRRHRRPPSPWRGARRRARAP
jgi:hypothetical protein